YSDGTAIGSATAAGTTTVITTNGSVDLADGARGITATQTEPGKLQSPHSAALTVNVDTQAPTGNRPDLNAGSDTGTDSGDNITQGNNPWFDGTAQDVTANGYASGLWKVQVTSDDGKTGVDSASPFYSVTLPTLDEGSRTVSATVYDVAGNTFITEALSVTVDRTGPQVTSMTPTPGTTQVGVASVRVGFDGDVTVNGTTFTLTKSGGDGQFGNGNDSLVTGTVSYDALTDIATFTASSSLTPDTYQVWLNGTASVTDVAGNRLDGEYSGTFPSGNGSAGGDFLATFNVIGNAGGPPTGVDLRPESDRGASNSDNITNLDNSDPNHVLLFEVTGTVAGATVRLYSGTTEIGSAVASGVTTVVSTNGTVDLPDGPRSITARQTEPYKQESGDSPALQVLVDTAAPNVITVSPASGATVSSVSTVRAWFADDLASASVNMSTFTLTASGGDGQFGNGNDAPVLATVTYDVDTDIATLTPTAPVSGDTYRARLDGTASVTDVAGNPLDGDYVWDFVVSQAPSLWWLGITQRRYVGTGAEEGEFWAEVMGPDAASALVYLPDGGVRVLSEVQQGVFEYAATGAFDAIVAQYQDGSYQFHVTYDSGPAW
ncbi:MAG: hypothetical protein FJ279_35470, partial [Planctomycetes bacterium]|nr:hypothetical protein [Planctomycetota bacterium]